jgi:hypothetical protein
MKVISEIHQDLKQILTEYSDWFFAQDLEKIEKYIVPRPNKDRNDKYTTNEYLQKCLKQPEKYGFPEKIWGLEIHHDRNTIPDKKLVEKTREVNEELLNFFGARNNALQLYYPPGGFIGWHNNGNAHGYNIILSCNPEGDGEFEHWDHVNNKLDVMEDTKGWSCKVGYFGKFSEPKEVYWHCARTRSPRLTFSFVIYDKNIWDDMIEDISAR